MQAHMAVVNRIWGGGFNDKIHLSVVTQFISRLLIICIFNNIFNNYNIQLILRPSVLTSGTKNMVNHRTNTVLERVGGEGVGGWGGGGEGSYCTLFPCFCKVK